MARYNAVLETMPGDIAEIVPWEVDPFHTRDAISITTSEALAKGTVLEQTAEGGTWGKVTAGTGALGILVSDIPASDEAQQVGIVSRCSVAVAEKLTIAAAADTAKAALVKQGIKLI